MIAAFSNLNAMRQNSAGFLSRLHATHGDVVPFRLGPLKTTLVTRPKDVLHVLISHASNYSKDTRANSKLAQVMGKGLLTADGKEWRVQRRIAQPAFHRKHIDEFVSLMGQCSMASVERLEKAAESENHIDLGQENNALTLDIVTRALFGEILHGDIPVLTHAVEEVQRQVNLRTFALFDAPMSIPTQNNRRLKTALGELDGIVYRLIREHMHGEMEGHTLMDLLLTSTVEERGASISAKALRDEVMTFFLAGHETTANLLSWTYLLLAQHPEVANRLHEEVEGCRVGPPTLDGLKSLPYLEGVVQEVLRLFPPIWGYPRAAVEPDTIGGHHIPAGSEVWVSPFVTQRHAELWSEPNRFRPERWLDTPEAELEKGSFFPFGIGARQCIGANFAKLEAKIAIACTVASFHFDMPAHVGLDYLPKVTLQPAQPVIARVERRLSPPGRGESVSQGVVREAREGDGSNVA